MDPYKRLQAVIITGFIFKASEISFHEIFFCTALILNYQDPGSPNLGFTLGM